MKGIYKIRFDLLPTGHQDVIVSWKEIEVLVNGKEEPAYNPKYKEIVDVVDECLQVNGNLKDSSAKFTKASINEFLELPVDIKKNAKSFQFKYGTNDNHRVDWIILQDNEQITEDPIKQRNDDDGSGGRRASQCE